MSLTTERKESLFVANSFGDRRHSTSSGRLLLHKKSGVWCYNFLIDFQAILLSICYSATIGGTGTLIGTGPNIVLNGFLEKSSILNEHYSLKLIFKKFILYRRFKL